MFVPSPLRVQPLPNVWVGGDRVHYAHGVFICWLEEAYEGVRGRKEGTYRSLSVADGMRLRASPCMLPLFLLFLPRFVTTTKWEGMWVCSWENARWTEFFLISCPSHSRENVAVACIYIFHFSSRPITPSLCSLSV